MISKKIVTSTGTTRVAHIADTGMIQATAMKSVLIVAGRALSTIMKGVTNGKTVHE